MISRTAEMSGLTSIRSHAARCRMIPSVAISLGVPVNFEKRRAWMWSILCSRSASGRPLSRFTIRFSLLLKISYEYVSVLHYRCFPPAAGCKLLAVFEKFGKVLAQWGIATLNCRRGNEDYTMVRFFGRDIFSIFVWRRRTVLAASSQKGKSVGCTSAREKLHRRFQILCEGCTGRFVTSWEERNLSSTFRRETWGLFSPESE